MTTKQAFEKLIYNLEMLQDANIPESTYRSWRKRFIEKRMTLDLMESILLKAGAKKTPEHWTFKKK